MMVPRDDTGTALYRTDTIHETGPFGTDDEA